MQKLKSRSERYTVKKACSSPTLISLLLPAFCSALQIRVDSGCGGNRFWLLRRRRENRQLGDVSWFVLDDNYGVQVSRDILETRKRCERLATISVE